MITAFIMHNNETGPTLLELLLQLEGDVRGRLEPIRVTPLQKGVPSFLCIHVVIP
jgi:hypothetical protein